MGRDRGRQKVREKYIKALFDEVEMGKIEGNWENSQYNVTLFVNYDIYIFNKRYYKLKSEQDSSIRKKLLLYLYKFNFYTPKIIKRVIFKKYLLQNEGKDIKHFNYNVYLLLSYMKNTNINESTQKIIDLDVFRTRINKNNKKTIYFFNLFLNYACNHFQFKYKQGLNEILALFFYLKGKCFNMIDVYFCFQNFVERFLKEFYYDDEFFFLQMTFFLFKVLIKYHDPVLSEVLENNKMTPEIYAASWFLTLFASKSNLKILNSIYLIFILEHNPFFYFFFSLALLILHRNVFLCVDSSNLPELLSKINIFSKKFLKKVWSLGKYLERNTPVSFTHKLFFIKNVLIYLTNDISEENHHKKDVLLNFFKSIDYMSINSYEIIKNVSSGRNKYIFMDIRPNGHFKRFHLRSSINVDTDQDYAQLLRERMDIREKRKKWEREVKIDKRIRYILKRYGDCEVVHSELLLFSYMLFKKHGGKININHDDNILLKGKNEHMGKKMLNEVNFGELERGEQGKRRKKRRRARRRIQRRERDARQNRKGGNLQSIGFLKFERDPVINLNFHILQNYREERNMKGGSKNRKVKVRTAKCFSRLYAEERNAHDCKMCYSDDNIVHRPFRLTCYHIKQGFYAKIREDAKREEASREDAKRGDAKRGDAKNGRENRDKGIHKVVESLPGEQHPGETHHGEPKLNVSSFNLYLLIKEKVLKDENLLQHTLTDVLNPKRDIIILYDDDFNNAKHVRRFYNHLIYNFKIKKVSIIEGGINAYHSLIRNENLDFNVKDSTSISNKIGKGKIMELPDFFLCYSLLKNKNVLNNIFHYPNLCYLCKYKNCKNAKKKILDVFFFEIYNDFTIFEDLYNFLTCQKEKTNLLAFLDLIIRKKNIERLRHSKREDSEGSSFHISSLLNYIKRKKGKDKEGNSSSLPSFVSPSMSNGKYPDDHDKPFYSSKKMSNSTVGDTNMCNHSRGKKDYFSINYYIDYCSRKKSELLNTPKNYDKGDSIDGEHTDELFDERNDQERAGKFPSERISASGDELYKGVNDVSAIDIPMQVDPLDAGRNLSIVTDITDRRSSTGLDVYNMFSYVDVLCYNSLLHSGESVKNGDINQIGQSSERSDKRGGRMRKVYSCFIEYVYQPLIPHNIRSNNVISNFVQYVKYFKSMKRSNSVSTINDPNLYLNCNKLDSRLFFNMSYFPFNSLRKLHFPSSIPCANANEGNLPTKDDSLYQTAREELVTDNHTGENLSIERANGTANAVLGVDQYDELLNDSIISNTWIKNRPELGLCKLMIYDYFLILYGTPYLQETNVLVSKTDKRKNGGNVNKATEKWDEEDQSKDMGNMESDCVDAIKGDNMEEGEEGEEVEEEGEEVEEEVEEEKEEKEEEEVEEEVEEEEVEEEEVEEEVEEEEEEDGKRENLDVGVLNFLKEKEKYGEKKGDLNLKYVDDRFHKIIIHKYKDLKKKDILFNIECYKINSININWCKLSHHIFASITKEHIADTYTHYKGYFHMSNNDLLLKEDTYSVRSISSCNTESYVSDKQDFSFSDYQSFYTKNVRSKPGTDRGNIQGVDEKEKEILLHQQVKIDVVNIYGIFDLRTIFKITTKRNSGKTLYFYFTTNRNIPLLALNFENDMEVQSCVCSVKEAYTLFVNEKGGN
ncbi:conserved Plasmodium protein, unknown function [Plasmodium ovale]|uniref:Rab-GAP TBC domain-containing protein n=1 Tax=Plasmodium ovale TaxID=36330 RepID=A0A1C3L5J7_PLAOA|nr:conserved Plasmodium protein, unknown function [Plasmodium ovale]